MQLNLSHVSCIPQQAKGVLIAGTDSINYVGRERIRTHCPASDNSASDQEAVKGPELNILKHMNSVPELLTARRVIDIVPLIVIVIVCHVGIIDSLDDCNRRSSFKDPFSAVDANSNAILSFPLYLRVPLFAARKHRSWVVTLPRPRFLGAVLRYTYIENTKWALHMAVLN